MCSWGELKAKCKGVSPTLRFGKVCFGGSNGWVLMRGKAFEIETRLRLFFLCFTRFLRQKSLLLQKHGDLIRHVEVIQECDWNRYKHDISHPAYKFLRNELYPKRAPIHLPLRCVLKGGKTESFRLLFKAWEYPNLDVKFKDVNALYSEVSRSFKRFPTGNCITLASVSTLSFSNSLCHTQLMTFICYQNCFQNCLFVSFQVSTNPRSSLDKRKQILL